jgi:hypothetical protein
MISKDHFSQRPLTDFHEIRRKLYAIGHIVLLASSNHSYNFNVTDARNIELEATLTIFNSGSRNDEW